MNSEIVQYEYIIMKKEMFLSQLNYYFPLLNENKWEIGHDSPRKI